MKRICVVLLAVLLLLCAACASPAEVPEETVVRFWAQGDRGDSTMIEMLSSGNENERWPSFSVKNEQGQKLAFGQGSAVGDMPLIFHRLIDDSENVYLGRYVIPLSEEYVLTFQQEKLHGRLISSEESLDARHYFDWDATDLQRLEYQVNTLTATGVNMTYELRVSCNQDGDEPVSFHMSGQSESQVMLKPQDDYFLVRSENSPCTLTYSCSGNYGPLGESPAGQWSKISRVSDVWVMEPLAD